MNIKNALLTKFYKPTLGTVHFNVPLYLASMSTFGKSCSAHPLLPKWLLDWVESFHGCHISWRQSHVFIVFLLFSLCCCRCCSSNDTAPKTFMFNDTAIWAWYIHWIWFLPQKTQQKMLSKSHAHLERCTKTPQKQTFFLRKIVC